MQKLKAFLIKYYNYFPADGWAFVIFILIFGILALIFY